ncbi:hypothetical protein EROM_110580 [Encephalitozoon romaleae SJ-2008]|uniref:Uncharacterized protein n=1 Tax=Encephalitozoon romaleae (strain SJ-2008) TaxID=1178016 RepID=I7AGW3_ENCRO|nr:hypothetical protein EROM_110580 [Encephalitozoon romaleae SJ-2008]AFN84040.1 hypothetical protein EROM_110580 [Encephalitozoon romaleae SJ-2008]
MDLWVRNFLKIKQDHTDPSDYEKFFTCFIDYLARCPSSHCEVSKILVKALDTFKNVHLISIAYRLLYCVDVELQIPESTLKKHFRSPYLREYMFPLLPRISPGLFDSTLLKLLRNPHYECKNFFNLMKSKRDWVVEFLGLKRGHLARKQMMLMVHTSIFHNMGYFITFFGHRDRSLSFLAFEAFKLFVEGLVRERRGNGSEGEAVPILLHKEATFSIWWNYENAWISPEARIRVESPTNFLIHFMDFISEKEKLQRHISTNDKNGVEAILKKYIDLGIPLSIPDSRWTSEASRCPETPKRECVEDICFEYLFNGKTYKEIMDCIEI